MYGRLMLSLPQGLALHKLIFIKTYESSGISRHLNPNIDFIILLPAYF